MTSNPIPRVFAGTPAAYPPSGSDPAALAVLVDSAILSSEHRIDRKRVILHQRRGGLQDDPARVCPRGPAGAWRLPAGRTVVDRVTCGDGTDRGRPSIPNFVSHDAVGGKMVETPRLSLDDNEGQQWPDV